MRMCCVTGGQPNPSDLPGLSRRQALRSLFIAAPVFFRWAPLSGPLPLLAEEVPQASDPPKVSNEELPLQTLSLSNDTIQILAPKSWFRSVRSDGLVVGDFRTTSILTVKILDAGLVFNDLLLTRSGVSGRSRSAPRMMWGGIGTSIDLANLFLSYRDYAAAVGGQQVSSATKVSIVPGTEFGVDTEVLQLNLLVRLEKTDVTISSTPSNTADTTGLVVPLILSGKSRGRLELAPGYKPAPLDTSASDAAAAVNQRKETENVVSVFERAGVEFILYQEKMQRIVIASFTAPMDVYDEALALKVCKSIRIISK